MITPRRAVLAALVPVAALLLTASPAHASTAVCVAEDPYHYSSVTASRISGVPTVYGDPCVTISIALYAGASVTATVTGSVSGEVSAIVAHADTQLSLSLAVSMTAAVTYTGSWTVPGNQTHTGYLGVGAESKHMAWSHGHYGGTGGCTWIIDRSGVLNAPYQLPYFWRGYV
jgi:hypothetical protein